ncbi:MAG: hypothetical protein HQK88_10475 [Nitrospirae bacterium]|nr:hypothetical protein [Nitrospirota bacterium]MBF0534925.1 hypothetical protein [Nitrospirota bacterium]MBF0617224.1 hypothetical protein [Nitrospirota bacterium]
MYRSGVIKGGKVERFSMPSLDGKNYGNVESESEAAVEDTPSESVQDAELPDEESAPEIQLSSPQPEEPDAPEPEEPAPNPEEIIREAQETARQLEQEAQRQGYENGFNAGREAGQNQAITEFNQKNLPLLDALAKIIEDLRNFKEGALNTLQPKVIQLALDVAKAALLGELKINPDVLVRLVKEGINRLKKTGSVTIKLNPALYDMFLSRKAELTELNPEILFEVDPALPPEGAVVIGPLEEVSVNPLELLDNIIEDMRELDAGG